MAGRLRCHHGGILGVFGLLEDPRHRRALEADLLRAGLRLRWFGTGDPNHSWADLVAFTQTLGRDSALGRAQGGEDAEWSLTDDLLALVADRLAIIHYSLTAKKGDPFPHMVSRHANNNGNVAGRSEEEPVADLVELGERNSSGRFVGEVTTIAETARRLGWAI